MRSMYFVFLSILPLVSSAFAHNNYPSSIPSNFKNAPYKFVCSQESITIVLEKYYNPREEWTVFLTIRNGTETEIVASFKRVSLLPNFVLFQLIDTSWKSPTELTGEELQELRRRYPYTEAEGKFLYSDCVGKESKFWKENNLDKLFGK